MKNLLLIFFLLVNFSAFCQKTLNGAFETRTGAGEESYIFYKDGTFEYSSGDCLFSKKGKGYHTIQNKILRLNFIKFDSLYNSVLIEEQDCKNFDTEKTVFYLKNRESKKPIDDGKIRLILKESRKEIGVIKIDNLYGISSIKIPSIYRDSLITAFTDVYQYKEYSFDFIPGFCKEIKVELVEKNHSHNQKVAGGTVREYGFKKFSEKYTKGIILHGDTSFQWPNGYDIILHKRKEKN